MYPRDIYATDLINIEHVSAVVREPDTTAHYTIYLMGQPALTHVHEDYAEFVKLEMRDLTEDAKKASKQ